MARFRKGPAPRGRTRSGWKTAAVVGAGALITAAAVKRGFARKLRDRSPLELNSECQVNILCPARCDGPERLSYKLPILSALALASLGDAVRLTSIRCAVTFAQMPASSIVIDPPSDSERFATEDVPWILRMVLCKQQTYLGPAATQLTPLVDPLDLHDQANTPLMRTWTKRRLGWQGDMEHQSDDELSLYTKTKLGPRQWTWSFVVPVSSLEDGEELNLWVSYGGLHVLGGDCPDYATYLGRSAQRVGFQVMSESIATIER